MSQSATASVPVAVVPPPGAPVPVKAQWSVSDLLQQGPIVAVLIYGIEKLTPIIQQNTEILGQVLEALRTVNQ